MNACRSTCPWNSYKHLYMIIVGKSMPINNYEQYKRVINQITGTLIIHIYDKIIFIVRPPTHYNRSEHSGNSNSHGSNDRRDLYLPQHCHHRSEICIKMGNDESHSDVWLTVRGKVTKRWLRCVCICVRACVRACVCVRL